jgi:hypothetical protein
MRDALLVAAAAIVAVACAPLPAVRGRVVDRDNGAGVGGAVVIEWRHGGGAMGEPQRSLATRFAETDADGRFAFAPSSASCAAWRADAPSYGFVAPHYGLVRAGVLATGSPIELRGSRDEAAAQSALASLCESAPREEWERTLRSRVCSSR